MTKRQQYIPSSLCKMRASCAWPYSGAAQTLLPGWGLHYPAGADATAGSVGPHQNNTTLVSRAPLWMLGVCSTHTGSNQSKSCCTQSALDKWWDQHGQSAMHAQQHAHARAGHLPACLCRLQPLLLWLQQRTCQAGGNSLKICHTQAHIRKCGKMQSDKPNVLSIQSSARRTCSVTQQVGWSTLVMQTAGQVAAGVQLLNSPGTTSCIGQMSATSETTLARIAPQSCWRCQGNSNMKTLTHTAAAADRIAHKPHACDRCCCCWLARILLAELPLVLILQRCLVAVHGIINVVVSLLQTCVCASTSVAGLLQQRTARHSMVG